MAFTTQSPRPPDVGRVRALDGVRGFAALAVVSSHFVVHMGLLPFTTFGFMGVVVFFALSGYLIARMLWRLEPSVSAYREFVRRRVRRLLPLTGVVAVVVGLVLTFYAGVPAGAVVRDMIAVSTQTMAGLMVAGIPVAAPFAPAWSLSVEWTFYLTFPVLLFVLRRRGFDPRQVRNVLGLAGVALYLVGLLLPAAAFYLLPVANLGVLALGAALAAEHERRSVESVPSGNDPAYSAMAMLMLGIFLLLPGDVLSWGWKLAVMPAATVSAIVVIHGCWAGVATARLLSARWLRAVGVRAYSLYLWHVPVMWLVWVTMPHSVPGVRALVSVAIVVPLVAVSYAVVELPVLDGRALTRTRAALAALPGSAAAKPAR